MHRACLRLALILLAFPSHAIAQSSAAPSVSDPPAPYSAEPYVVEQLRTAWRFEADGTGRKDVSLRVKVQSETGTRAWGQLVFPYNAANERMDIVSVRVSKADGTTVDAAADAVQDLTSSVERLAPVYSDLREKHVTVPGLRPGDTLEYTVATTIHTALAPGHFWTEHNFAAAGIVLDEQFEVDVPGEKELVLKTRPDAEPTIVERKGRKIYTWYSSRLENERRDDRSTDRKPEKKKPEPAAVRLSTFLTWDAVGRWYGALEGPQKAPTPDVRRKAAELTAGRTTELEKLQALYEYVATNFRYVSLSFGVGRYQPHAAADVLRNQYGDCKDKHTLLASLAESIGLHASAALVNSHLDVDPDFPSPSQFDHVITRVATAKGDIWLDTTAEVAPFRLLMPTLRDKRALVIDAAQHGRLENTPAQSPVAHSSDVHVDATLDDAGTLAAHVRLAMTGDFELLLRMMLHQLPATEWKAIVTAMMSREGLDGDISDLHFSDPVALHEPFTAEWKVAKANFVSWTKSESKLMLPLEGFVSLPRYEEDTDATSIELGPPHRVSYELRMELPPSFGTQMPVPVSITRDYANYRAEYKIQSHVFTAARTLTVGDIKLPVDRRSDYDAFRRVVNRDLLQPLELKGASTAAGGTSARLKADELEETGHKAIEEGSYARAIELLKRATELEPAHKSAWNSLGRAYVDLHQPELAIPALRKQIAINAYHPYAYNNLGRAYVLERKYSDAEAAFKKQIEINPLDEFAHRNLGDMYLEWHKYEPAAAELERAVALEPKDAELHVHLGEAYLNLRKHDKAIDEFQAAADFNGGATTWNEIAYRLAVANTDLDLGLRYAESAVTSMAVASRNLSVDHVTPYGLWEISELAACWDTLGWLYAAKGDFATAEKFVRAAWLVTQHAEVGDHLAQIDEKLGRRADAIRMYAMALNAERPEEKTRERLAKLLGRGDSVDAAVGRFGAELVRERTIAVDRSGTAGATADFFVMFGPHSVEGVAFIGGDERLRASADALRALTDRATFPDDLPARLLRRGTLSCSAEGRCEFVLMPPRDAQLAQQR
jgi:tetratricopeptide (TPR) repeat protein